MEVLNAQQVNEFTTDFYILSNLLFLLIKDI